MRIDRSTTHAHDTGRHSIRLEGHDHRHQVLGEMDAQHWDKWESDKLDG